MSEKGNAIGLNYARQLANNYKKFKLGHVLPAEDSKAVWFSKEIILQALGLSPDTVTDGVTGIRIYFGAYQSVEGYPANTADYNKLTLVLVPTGDEHIDIMRGSESESFFLDIIDDPSVQPSYPSGVGDGPASTGMTGTSSKGYYNDGQLVPPPPAPSTSAALGLLGW